MLDMVRPFPSVVAWCFAASVDAHVRIRMRAKHVRVARAPLCRYVCVLAWEMWSRGPRHEIGVGKKGDPAGTLGKEKGSFFAVGKGAKLGGDERERQQRIERVAPLGIRLGIPGAPRFLERAHPGRLDFACRLVRAGISALSAPYAKWTSYTPFPPSEGMFCLKIQTWYSVTASRTARLL